MNLPWVDLFREQGDYVRFFVSGRYSYSKGYLYGIREFNPTDISYFDNPNAWQIKATGDGAIVPMNRNKSLSTTTKLTIRPSGMFKINYDLILSNGQNQYYSQAFKYNPDANPFHYSNGAVHTLEITHTLSSSTFYTVRGSLGTETNKSYLYENPA